VRLNAACLLLELSASKFLPELQVAFEDKADSHTAHHVSIGGGTLAAMYSSKTTICKR
jgi:hypothetical protein